MVGHNGTTFIQSKTLNESPETILHNWCPRKMLQL